VDPSKVWPQKALAPVSGTGGSGVNGDPGRASAELGRLGTELIVRDSVTAIRKALAMPR